MHIHYIISNINPNKSDLQGVVLWTLVRILISSQQTLSTASGPCFKSLQVFSNTPLNGTKSCNPANYHL